MQYNIACALNVSKCSYCVLFGFTIAQLVSLTGIFQAYCENACMESIGVARDKE